MENLKNQKIIYFENCDENDIDNLRSATEIIIIHQFTVENPSQLNLPYSLKYLIFRDLAVQTMTPFKIPYGCIIKIMSFIGDDRYIKRTVFELDDNLLNDYENNDIFVMKNAKNIFTVEKLTNNKILRKYNNTIQIELDFICKVDDEGYIVITEEKFNEII